jgi:alkanesulfonate monooxygenase SsuD/methylene tetrahydromethanopterin reductase-like flavin-dependent oxidoreductase (luciferase family)
MARKQRRRDASMRFGVFWPYSQAPMPSAEIARRNPDVLDLQNHVRLAQAIERIGVDFALIADGYAPGSEASSAVGFQDPSTNAIVWVVPLMMATTQLGWLSTIHTRFVHPVVVARLGAHLDFISGGRWGWNIVNGYREHEARLFGFDGLDHDGGYDLSDEALQIVKELWKNEPSGVDHVGTHFKVQGRIRRPVPETTPLLVSAASSPRGRRFAATHCDYLFANVYTPEEGRALADELDGYAAAGGREAPQILVLADVFIRDEPGAASTEYAELQGTRDRDAQKAWSAQLANVTRGRSAEDIMRFIGTTDEVADQLIALRRASPVAGVVIRPILWAPEELLRLEPVFAKLRAAGVWTPPAEREHSW